MHCQKTVLLHQQWLEFVAIQTKTQLSTAGPYKQVIFHQRSFSREPLQPPEEAKEFYVYVPGVQKSDYHQFVKQEVNSTQNSDSQLANYHL